MISMARSDPLGTLRRILSVALLSGMPLVSGCYTYRLVEDAPVGSVARLRVPLQSAVVGPSLSPETVAVEGLILSSGDTVSLEASTRQVAGAFREFVQYDTLRVARDGLASIEVREFAVVRSLAFGAGIAAGTVAIALAALGTEGGEAGERPDRGGFGSFTAAVNAAIGAVRTLYGR